MGKKDFDFSGWATRNDLKCSDGRTIKKDAFIECDGKVVPLVWNHLHNDPTNVLGHALLENREEGVYTYGTFNDTPAGKNAKELVTHGDVTSLSIYANRLKQNGGDVLHGVIREVSLVLAGANPGASIDAVLEHGDYGDEYSEEEAIIYTGEDLTFDKTEEIEHSEEKKEEEVVEETKNTEELEHAEEEKKDDETVQDVIDSMNEKQKKVMYALIGAALEDGKEKQPEEGDNKGEDMKHNVFDTDEKNAAQKAVFTVEDQKKVIADAKKYGSLKDSFLAHAEEMGVESVDYLAHDDDPSGIEYSSGNQQYFVNQPSFLFPEARALNNPPAWIKRRTDWVSVVMNGTHHTPFARIKSVFADITADEARAKGYMKGNLKTEEVFTLLKRTTTPTTVYKKQKMDRDDVIDITDFDVVAWIKGEMRVMLDEEIARAVLIGDGRSGASNDKINEQNIRPIWTDADLFTIKQTVAGGTPAQVAENMIDDAVRARKNYQGSGNPVLFTTEDNLTEMLLLKDEMGHRLYKNESELATAMRVSRIVTVQVMENKTRSVTVEGVSKTATLQGIIVNMNDYAIGADKGGAVAMFDDFDIDYNQQKYLIETRCSGALINPYSAIVLETVA